MEEKDIQGQNPKPEKLSYDELRSYYNELQIQYGKAMEHIQRLHAELDSRETTSFVLSTLFKVMEHPNRYSEKFIKWATANIEASVTALIASLTAPEEEEKKDEEAR